MDLPIAANAVVYEEPKVHRRHDLLDLLGRGGFEENVATRACTMYDESGALLPPSREGRACAFKGSLDPLGSRSSSSELSSCVRPVALSISPAVNTLFLDAVDGRFSAP